MGRVRGRTERTARLLKIQILLWQYPKGLGVAEIAQRCSISKRTVYRDLKSIEAELQVPVWEEGNKRGILDGYFLPPISFSLAEAAYLFLAARMMQNCLYVNNPNVISTFMKLNTIVPPPLRQQIRNIIDFMDKQPKNEMKISNLDKLLNAWIKQHKTIIRYQDIGDPEPIEYIIEPYFIEPGMLRRSFYVIAYCYPKQSVCTFKIEKIVGEVMVTSDNYQIPDGFNIIDHLNSSWGPYFENEIQTIKLKFSKNVSRSVTTTIWHPSQIVEIQKDGSLIMTLKLRNNRLFLSWVLGWGRDVELIEPESMRQQIIQMGQWIGQIYSSTPEPNLASVNAGFYIKATPEAITNEQWQRVARWLPHPQSGVGRPRADDRKIINGILCVIKHKMSWNQIPEEYGPPSTCFSRFKEWQKSGVWDNIRTDILLSN